MMLVGCHDSAFLSLSLITYKLLIQKTKTQITNLQLHSKRHLHLHRLLVNVLTNIFPCTDVATFLLHNLKKLVYLWTNILGEVTVTELRERSGWGAGEPHLFSVKREEMTEGTNAGRTSKTKQPPFPQGLDPPQIGKRSQGWDHLLKEQRLNRRSLNQGLEEIKVYFHMLLVFHRNMFHENMGATIREILRIF